MLAAGVPVQRPSRGAVPQCGQPPDAGAPVPLPTRPRRTRYRNHRSWVQTILLFHRLRIPEQRQLFALSLKDYRYVLGARPREVAEYSLLDVLLSARPQALLLEEQWVDVLISEYRVRAGRDSCLMFAVCAPSATAECMRCRRLGELLGRYKHMSGEEGLSLLQKICLCNPALLNYDLQWLGDLIERSGGKTNRHQGTSLMLLFRSHRVNQVDFGSRQFRRLFGMEFQIQLPGQNYLLHEMCRSCPHLLGRGLWFVGRVLEQRHYLGVKVSAAAQLLGRTECIYQVDFESDDVAAVVREAQREENGRLRRQINGALQCRRLGNARLLDSECASADPEISRVLGASGDDFRFGALALSRAEVAAHVQGIPALFGFAQREFWAPYQHELSSLREEYGEICVAADSCGTQPSLRIPPD